MRAVVFDFDRKIKLAERPKPSPSESGVLIRPSFIGICGTDLHAEALDHFRPGVVIGHEFGGVVVDRGPLVTAFETGARVMVNPNGNLCHECAQCKGGRPNLCARAVFERGVGIHRDGGMAEFVAVEAETLVAIPDTVNDKEIAWVEPLATAVRAARQSPTTEDSLSVVIGAGPIGLLIVQLLSQRPGRVGVVEPSPFRRELAQHLGASFATAPDGAVQPSTADVVYEASGTKEGFSTAIALARPGTTIVVVGLATEPLSLEPFPLVGRELRIHGSIIYDRRDLDDAVAALSTSTVDVASLTTDVMPIERFEEAFSMLRNPEAAVKVLLHP